jgi:hypothetical protein
MRSALAILILLSPLTGGVALAQISRSPQFTPRPFVPGPSGPSAASRKAAVPGEMVLNPANEGNESNIPPWQTLAEITRQLKSDEGTLAIFRNSPGLQGRFPSEEHFQDFVGKWRQRLMVLPPRPDDPNATDDISWEINPRDSAQVVSLTFHHKIPENAITVLKIVWENDQVADITFSRGFSSVITRGGRYYPRWFGFR